MSGISGQDKRAHVIAFCPLFISSSSMSMLDVTTPRLRIIELSTKNRPRQVQAMICGCFPCMHRYREPNPDSLQLLRKVTSDFIHNRCHPFPIQRLLVIFALSLSLNTSLPTRKRPNWDPLCGREKNTHKWNFTHICLLFVVLFETLAFRPCAVRENF